MTFAQGRHVNAWRVLCRVLAGSKRVKVGAFQAAQDGDPGIRMAAAHVIPVLHGACSQSLPDEAAFLQLCLDALTRCPAFSHNASWAHLAWAWMTVVI